MYIKNNLLEPGVSSWNMTLIESQNLNYNCRFSHLNTAQLFGVQEGIHSPRKEIDNIRASIQEDESYIKFIRGRQIIGGEKEMEEAFGMLELAVAV